MPSSVPHRVPSRTGERGEPWGNRATWVLVGALTVVVFAAFLPALSAEFLNWDDQANFIENEAYRGLGWHNLRWMATTFHLGVYQPVSWLVLGLQYVGFELNPAGYHLTSVLLHVAGVVVFFFVSRRLLSLAAPTAPHAPSGALSVGALLAALLFGVHPLRTESVVWLSGQPYTVCILFYLLSVLFYLRAQTGDGEHYHYRRRIALALVCFGAALLSKAPAVSLPAVLLVLDVYPLRRLGGAAGWWSPSAVRAWAEKLPFVLMAPPIVVLAVFAKSDVMMPLEHHGAAARVAHSAFGIWFYLQKTIVPTALLPFYEMPHPLVWTEPRFLAAQAFVVTVSLALIILRRRCPSLLAVWTCYVLMLAPNLGVVQYGSQLAADRYSHLACMGWAVLAGGVVGRLWRTCPGPLPRVVAAAGLALAGGLGTLTWCHAERWQSSEKLWGYTVAHARDCWFARESLGTAKLDAGKYDDAIAEFREVLRVKPDYAKAHYNIGLSLRRRGNNEAAIPELARAVELDPDYAAALYNLGNALAERGELERAVETYRRAADAAPEDRDTHHNLGVALYKLGRTEEAIGEFRRALQIEPNWTEGHIKLALALNAHGNVREAVELLQRALITAGDDAEARTEVQSLLRALSPTSRPED